MTTHGMRIALIIGLGGLFAAGVSPVAAQTDNGEWRSYGGDIANTRYSPLDQITADNFNDLEVAWRLDTTNFGPEPEFNFQSTPLMVDGVLYSTAGLRRAAIAVDAGTGELLWMYRLDEGERAEVAPRRRSGRGLAYRDNGGDGEIFYVTPGYRLIGLNAKTGERLSGFGEDGIVDLMQNMDQEIDPLSGENRPARRAAGGRRHDHRRRGARSRRSAALDAQHQGLRPRLRRGHRRPQVDLPHDSGRGRVRQRHVAERLVALHRKHRGVGADQRRPRARHRLFRDRDADQRLLRRPPARRQPLLGQPGGRGPSTPASGCGTSSSSTTTCGTGTCRARRSWPT